MNMATPGDRTAMGDETDLEPESKRPKLTETIENVIAKITKTTKPLQAILSDEYYEPVTFTKVYVGAVKKLTDMSKTILTLNEKIPLKELGHLKRAFRKEVVLFPVDYLHTQNHAAIRGYIEEHASELIDAFEYFKVTEVPATAPKVRKQYQQCVKNWTCHFHPDPVLEMYMNGQAFTAVETEAHRQYMAMAFEVVRFYASLTNNNLTLEDIVSKDLNATLVVDPSINSVVAIAYDNRKDHPVQHSTMLAIDNVAKTQNGGAWYNSMEAESIKFRGISKNLLVHLKKKYPGVRFGAKPYKTKKEVEKEKLHPSECPYLCTGYNIYVVREPCLMCAMGLVHARSKRVFFCLKQEMGVLGSKVKLQCVPSLNHHFEVFTDFL